MFQDLDETLKVLLRHELPRGIGVSFATPDQDFLANLTQVSPPLVNLFLYDLRENRDLRGNRWAVTRQGEPAVFERTPPPARVDCSYLVTAWTKSDRKEAERGTREEHYLLGLVAQALLRHHTIPETMLRGSLRQQEPPRPCITLGGGHLQSPSEFWHAMGGKPRASLHYTVTIALRPWDAADLGPPVAEHLLELQPQVRANDRI